MFLRVVGRYPVILLRLIEDTSNLLNYHQYFEFGWLELDTGTIVMIAMIIFDLVRNRYFSHLVSAKCCRLHGAVITHRQTTRWWFSNMLCDVFAFSKCVGRRFRSDQVLSDVLAIRYGSRY